MRKLDYNKIMYVVGIIFAIIFCGNVIKDYISYSTADISVPFYLFVIIRSIEFALPSVIFFYLYTQNTFIKELHYTVKSKKLQEVTNYKIAQISDFHNTNSRRLKLKIIKKLKMNKPDIIVITGDLIDSRRTNIQCAKEFVEKITSIAPVYYILGNHEARLKNIDKLEDAICNAGAIILRNKSIKLTEELQLIGLDDPAFYTLVKEQNKEQMEKYIMFKLKELVKNYNEFNILITHRPELINAYAKCGVDLALTGHAHGGQIRIPFIGGIIAPGQGVFPKYTKGMYSVDSTILVVSRGIGNSKFPFRINNRPELVFVTLEK